MIVYLFVGAAYSNEDITAAFPSQFYTEKWCRTWVLSSLFEIVYKLFKQFFYFLLFIPALLQCP